jgi:hypothetical protein
VVVMNREEGAINFALKYRGQAAQAVAPAHSISTFRFAS